MPGAGSLIATNFLYTKAPQDGTYLGSVSRNIPNYAFMKQANANFDPLRFQLDRQPEMTHRACYARADSGVTSPEHLYERELLMGGDGAGTLALGNADSLAQPARHEVQGDRRLQGLVEIVLAMARNEVGRHLPDDDGLCAGGAAPPRQRRGAACCSRPSRERVAKYNVPTIFEHAKTEEQRSILAFHASSLETGRPWLAPPNVPAERVQALRRAYDATMKDRAFLEEAKLRKMEVAPSPAAASTSGIR